LLSLALIPAAALVCSGPAKGQIAITGTSAVTENFNGMTTSASASLPANWKMTAAGLGLTAGWATGTNLVATNQQASSGAPTTGARYNWGNGTTTSDRAVGFMTSGSYLSPNAVMAHYVNSTGANITQLAVSFDIERYRINTAAASVTFWYSLNGTDWIAATSGDTGPFATGSSAYNFTTGTVVSKSFFISSLSIPNGSAFYLKWFFNTTGGSSQGLGLDNVSITATTDGSTDSIPPAIASRFPLPGATGVALDAEMSITFDEPVIAGAGTVKLYEEAGATDVLIPIGTVTVVGPNVTFFPVSNLEYSKTYYVLIDNNAFTDQATPANSFGGISSSTAWSFTTIAPDTTGPVVTTLSPLNGATGVQVNVQPVVTFNETLTALTGEVLIKKANGDLVDSLNVADTNEVTFFENQMQLKPTVTLPSGTELYIEIPSGVVEDALGNENLVAGGNGVWNFTTRVIPSLTASGPYLQEFTGFAAATPTLPDGWSLSGPVTTFNADPVHQVWTEGFLSGLRGGADLLGFQHTSGTGVLVKTLTLINGTASPITDLTISYTGHASRIVELRKPAYTVEINGVPVPGLAYSTASGDAVAKNAGVSGLSIAAGATFTITWSSARDSGQTSGASSQIGLDNINISIGLEVFPPSVGVTTADYPSLGTTTASVASDVTSDGGAPITSRGFVYSPTSSNAMPTIGGLSVSQEVITPAEVSAMTKTLTSLTPATSYTVRSYATNTEGTTYSAPITLVTLGAPPLFSTEYTQSFVGFSGSIVAGGFPAGWKLLSTTGANNYVGAWGPTSSSGGIVGGDVTQGVLGYQHSGTTGVATATLTLKNDTGAELTQLYVSYLGRVERPTETRSPVWTVTVAGTTVPELSYSTASGVDETKSHLVTGLTIPVDAEFTITWVSDTAVGTSGSRRQIGISDVTVGLNTPANDYGAWVAGFFTGVTDPLIIGFTADPDGDGISNGVEALIGGDPSVAGVFGTTELVKTGNTFSFLYPQNRDLPTGLSAGYEWSTDMVTWNVSGATQGGVTVMLADDVWTDTGSGPITYQVVATVTAGTPAKLFVRVLSVNQ